MWYLAVFAVSIVLGLLAAKNGEQHKESSEKIQLLKNGEVVKEVTYSELRDNYKSYDFDAVKAGDLVHSADSVIDFIIDLDYKDDELNVLILKSVSCFMDFFYEDEYDWSLVKEEYRKELQDKLPE